MLIMVGGILYLNRSNNIPPQLKTFFFWGLISRIAGSLAFALIHQYLYRNGDTWNYFTYGSYYMWEALLAQPDAAWDMLWQPGNIEYMPNTWEYIQNMQAWRGGNLMIKLSFVLGFFTAHTYLGNSFILSIFAFWGLWRIYVVFTSLYPHLYKPLAWACLFTPSIIFWSSGIMKEPICMGALGGVFYAFYRMNNKVTLSLILQFIIFAVVLLIFKSYIFLSFLGVGVYWIFLKTRAKINNPTLRFMGSIILGFLFLFIGIGALSAVGKIDPKYSLEQLSETMEVTARYLYYKGMSEQGSAYALGDTDYSALGLLRKVIPGINVSLFRPYPFESKNIVMLLSSFESTIFLILTGMLLFKLLLNPKLLSAKIPIIISFSLVFALVFSFFIGVSTLNFGTLVRYRIPIIPFYVSTVIIMMNIYGTQKKINNYK
jgi:hypothetical protein